MVGWNLHLHCTLCMAAQCTVQTTNYLQLLANLLNIES